MTADTHQIETLILVAAVAVASAILLARLRFPAVTGLLLAGAVLGPHGLGVVQDNALIEMLSKAGVVLLLFSIGLEFTPHHLVRNFKVLALGGLLQTGLTLLAAMLGALALGYSWRRSLFLGFVVSMSSTAVVLRGLQERGDLHAPHGQIIFGALLFQDLCVVPMLAVLPLLAGKATLSGPLSGALVIIESLGLIIVAYFGGRAVVPRLFARVQALQGRDVFLLAVLLTLMSLCWITAKAGLGVALGAFLAGMLLADADLGEKALADVLPFRDLFAAIFFVSLGMLFDASTPWKHPVWFLGLLATFTLGKSLTSALAARLLGFPWKVAALAGLGLAQFGEFGFVLLESGKHYKLINPAAELVILSAGVASLFISPLLFRLAPRFLAGERVLAPLERLLGLRGADRSHARVQELRPKALLLGFGQAGRALGARLRAQGIAFVALEDDPETARLAQAEGWPVLYGNANSPEALAHAGVAEVRSVISLTAGEASWRGALTAMASARPDLTLLILAPRGEQRGSLFKLKGRLAIVDDLDMAAAMLKRSL